METQTGDRCSVCVKLLDNEGASPFIKTAKIVSTIRDPGSAAQRRGRNFERAHGRFHCGHDRGAAAGD